MTDSNTMNGVEVLIPFIDTSQKTECSLGAYNFWFSNDWYKFIFH